MGHSVAEIFYVEVKWHETNNSGNNFLFMFIVFAKSVANMVANYICIKYKSKV